MLSTYLQWVQHEAQTGTFCGEDGLLEIALATRWDIVHLRPDIRHGELSDVPEIGVLWWRAQNNRWVGAAPDARSA